MSGSGLPEPVAGMNCYLNGEYLPIDEARVSPLDRGFLFGDGAYELIPVYSRRPFRCDEHLKRLQQTLDGIRLANPLTHGQWAAVVERLIADAPDDDQSIYLQVTRGADTKRDHAFPKGVAPTVFAFSAPLVTTPQAVRDQGIACITVVDSRWLHCNLKVLALLPNVLLRQQAIDDACVEAILLRDGYLTEGAASNIFVCKDGRLLAPPKDHRMLPGITYDVVLELAARHGMPHVVREISADELKTADEVWMTSSTKEVLPVTLLDGKPVGTGVPGPMAKQMYRWYVGFRDEVMRHRDG
jgi:D-alanine transaminase